MRGAEDLERTLRRIDGRGYKAYRDVAGAWQLDGCTLFVDRVQGDPFAAPSRVRVRLDRRDAALPPELCDAPLRRVALADHLARRVAAGIRRAEPPRRGSGHSGAIAVDAGGQEVLERTAVCIAEAWVEARLEVGLPAAGRRVLGREAAALLCGDVPELAVGALCLEPDAVDAARRFVACVENQEAIRAALRERGLVAFVADGALLPRASGASDRPLDPERAVPFQSPESLRVSFELPHAAPPATEARAVSGLGIPAGVTLVVGGGYHGKSTLLHALARGVHPHVPGDGREGVVCDADAVQVRAEDGRAVTAVDISGFIDTLPGGRSTRAFDSQDASGSTSQAAAIAEALESGARALLIDEDTSATNFMVRDARMQALVHDRDEPITPFVERVRELYERFGVSSVLVMGGSGDYFDVADTVIRMRAYRPEDATREAREVAAALPTARRSEAAHPLPAERRRAPLARSFDASRGRRAAVIDARAHDTLRFGHETVDLRAVEQLLDPSQTRAVGRALHAFASRADGATPLAALLDALEAEIDAGGLEAIAGARPGEHPGRLARPRRHEIAAAVNRLRTLRVRAARSGDRGPPRGASG